MLNCGGWTLPPCNCLSRHDMTWFTIQKHQAGLFQGRWDCSSLKPSGVISSVAENPPAIAVIVRGYGGPRPFFVGSWQFLVMVAIGSHAQNTWMHHSTIVIYTYIYIYYLLHLCTCICVGTGTQYKCVRIYVSTCVLYVNWLYIYTNIHVYTWDKTWRNIINFIFDG